ncbi:MAG: hypothetical protein AMS24_05385, partial [Chlamydiae bacterium SM23_39]
MHKWDEYYTPFDNIYLSKAGNYIKNLYIKEDSALNFLGRINNLGYADTNINKFLLGIRRVLVGITFKKLEKIYVYIEDGYIKGKKLPGKELFKEKLKSLDKKFLHENNMRDIEIICSKDDE